jgi:CheY-like chemotaxis protein/HPt (histidine-containing phosphotransfer) domain-containing protein
VSDVTRLRQVLVNLIGNAVKFTPEGEVAIVVRAADRPALPSPGTESGAENARNPDNWLLHFSVRDTGIGIPLDRQHRLFKSFQQVDASTTRHYGGTGLGLAISKRLAELLGGKIWVESDAGKGSTFHFTITARAAAATAPPSWSGPQPQLAGKRLLVVEDNATNRTLIKNRAEQWGLTVETAAHRREAMGMIAQSKPFDAVILDSQLPGQDTSALAEEIRQQPNGRYLPVLALSALRLRNDDPVMDRVGASVTIHKPIRPGQLLDALCRGLSVQPARDKRAPTTPSLDTNLARHLPLRLLLADDNPINQKVGLSVLHKLGYSADVANNGLEVIQALASKNYDLLFLDVQMPEMDGMEAARQICHRWPVEKRPRIIAMTGNALMGDREKCLDAGMDDYISKPVRVAELQKAIERWGPTKVKTTETAFLARYQTLPSDHFIDSAVIAELRDMPPMNGVSMLNELLDLFLVEAPRQIALLHQHVSDPAKLEFHAHALKSTALNLGAKRIVEISQRLEELGRNKILDSAPVLLSELQAVLIQTRTHLLPLRDQ